MKVRITATNFAVPAGTIMDVGNSIPRGWEGKCVPVMDIADIGMPITEYVHPLDHDGDGRKGGDWRRRKAKS